MSCSFFVAGQPHCICDPRKSTFASWNFLHGSVLGGEVQNLNADKKTQYFLSLLCYLSVQQLFTVNSNYYARLRLDGREKGLIPQEFVFNDANIAHVVIPLY